MRLAPVVVLIAAGLVVPGLPQESSPAAQQLIELSRKAADLTEIGPYRLQATVILAPESSKPLKGQITIFRDKDLYHSELQIRDFHESRWIKDNTLYIGRSQPVPVAGTPLLGQLDRLWRPRLVPGDAKISRTFKHKQRGRELECIEVQHHDSTNQKLCFDLSNSALVTESKVEFHDLEFQDFQTIDQKVFPGRIVFRSEDSTALEVRDINVAKANPTRDTFLPPDGAKGFPTCDEPTPVHKVKDAVPTMPKDEMRRMPRAEVYLYGIVGTTGNVQNISVEYSPHAAFTASAVDAMKQWQYAPAACGDKPVPAEVETRVRYFIP